MRKLAAITILAIFLIVPSPSQRPVPQKFADPQPMPNDRAADSYEIYSELLVNGPIEWRQVKRSQWLISDRTHATPMNEVCHPYGVGTVGDPHNAVTPPPERKAEWLELLADYDRHCNDVLHLDGGSFHVALPVHMLDEAGRNSFALHRLDFDDAKGLHSFSEVYFNPQHTLALVYQSMSCRGACGMWTWIVLERKGDRWKILPWRHVTMVS